MYFYEGFQGTPVKYNSVCNDAYVLINMLEICFEGLLCPNELFYSLKENA